MSLWRACLAGVALVSMLFLTACVNKEPEERAAFLQLLQSRVAEGALVPLTELTKPEKQAVGDYASAYEVMIDFQQALIKAAQPLHAVLDAETLRSVGDIVERQATLAAARKTLADAAGKLDDARAKADAARAALTLPPDLAPVYDGVYDEAVTAPAAQMMQAASRMDAAARDALEVASFVAANAAQIQLDEGQARVATPTLEQELNLRLQGLNAQSEGLANARKTLHMVSGQGA